MKGHIKGYATACFSGPTESRCARGELSKWTQGAPPKPFSMGLEKVCFRKTRFSRIFFPVAKTPQTRLLVVWDGQT